MTEGSRLPGTDAEEESDPIILHVDMDCFYAACERRREPELEGEPVVVGMGYEGGETHGAVATASYEAREYGVESAQAISTALERLPRKAKVEEKIDAGEDPDSDVDSDESGYYRPVDMDYYDEVSSEVKEILHESADVVREVSIDEAYLDVTDRTAWEVAEGFARHVKHRIDDEVGVTASVGVAPSMSAAKIASDHDKPDGLVVVEPGEVREFLAPLDVAEIHGVGPVTARALREMDVETAADLADADRSALEDQFGERGVEMHRRARGEDDREVTPTGKPKSLSRESAFTEATDDDEPKRDQIRTLADAVADRASRKGAMYRTIGVKAVTPPYDVNTRAKSLPGPVDDPELVEEVALELFAEFEGVEVRKVGVRVSNLSFADADQASLGDGWDAVASGGGDSGRSGGSADSASVTGPVNEADGERADSDGNERGRDLGRKSTADGTIKLTDISPADGGAGDADRDSAADGDSKDRGDSGEDGAADRPPTAEPDLNGQVSLEAGWERFQPETDDAADRGPDEGESEESAPDEADAESESDSSLDGQVSLSEFGSQQP
jgi:DNA polymerase IV (DinB-like DNA polymerase)